jgi:hypothetical protein
VLLDDAREVKKLATDYQVARDQAMQLNAYRTRAEQIGKVRRRVHEFRLAAELLAKSKLSIDEIQPGADGVLTTIRNIGKLAASPTGVGGPEAAQDFNNLRTRGENALNQTDAILRRIWSSYVDARVEQPDPGILAELERLAEFKRAASEVRVIQAKVRQCQEALPTEDSLARLSELARQLKGAWKTFDNVPPDVVEFLKSASRTGASLSTLTDTVLQWIRRNRLENSFLIRAAGSGAPNVYGR